MLKEMNKCFRVGLSKVELMMEYRQVQSRWVESSRESRA